MKLTNAYYSLRAAGFIAMGLMIIFASMAAQPGLQRKIEGLQEITDRLRKLTTENENQTASHEGEKWLSNNNLTPTTLNTEITDLLELIAQAYTSQGLHQKALPIRQNIVNINNQKFGANHIRSAKSQNSLAITYYSLGQHDLAIKHLTSIVKIIDRHFGSNHPETATAIGNLAMAYSGIGDYHSALPLMERALNIKKDLQGLEHLSTAVSMHQISAIHIAMEHYDKALPLQEKAVDIMKNVHGINHPDTAVALNSLGLILHGLGNFERASSIQERVLDINRKLLDDNHPAIAISLQNLAITKLSQGEYEIALPLFERARAILESSFGNAHPYIAINSSSHGLILNMLGAHDEATELHNRAVSLIEASRSSSASDYANILSNRAISSIFLRRYEEAENDQKKALEIYEKKFGFEHQTVARVINNIAITQLAASQNSNAIDLLKASAGINEKLLGENHPSTASSLDNLGVAYFISGKHEQALRHHLKSLTIREAVLGPEHPDTAASIFFIGLNHYRLGNHQLAVLLLKRAVNIIQQQRSRVLGLGIDYLKSYSLFSEEFYQALIDILIEQGRLSEAQQVFDMLKEDEVFDFIRRSSSADPRRTRIAYTPTEARWAARYREVADRLASLGVEERQLQQKVKQGLSPTEKARLNTLKADLEVAEKAFMAFLGDMQQKLSAQGPSKVDEVAATSVDAQRELQKVIGDLGPNVVLLQYYVTNDKVGMLMTTPNVVIPFSSEIDARKLNRDIFDFRRALRDPKTDILPASQALYKLLMSPVADALDQAGAKTVMLSLDGNLRHLPFGALHDGKQFLAQRWTLPVYTAVTRDKLREGSSTRWRAAGLGVTRAIGEFKALPAVKVEMDGLLRASGGGASQSVVYLDDQFTATKLKEVGQRDFQLMHISSHFSISPGTEVNSFLLLGDGQRLTLGDIRTQNYRFDNVDLLTLSACDTGLGGGRDANGREIEGLGVIAQQQGAKGVLATLWPVADGSTAKLMADMYQRRQSRGLSKIEALRQAQLALMSEPRYSHPFYWAPFILLGNWQ